MKDAWKKDTPGEGRPEVKVTSCERVFQAKGTRTSAQ